MSTSSDNSDVNTTDLSEPPEEDTYVPVACLAHAVHYPPSFIEFWLKINKVPMVRYNKDVYAERNEAYNALQSALRNIRFVDKLPDDVMPMREVSAFSHKLSRYIKKCPDFVVLTYYLPGARKDSGGIKAVKAVNKRSVLMAFCHLYGDSDSIATL